MIDARQYAPATARNREPILEVLKSWLPTDARVLEIASGTGEHGVYFTQALSSLLWQPTDQNEAAIASISAWRAASNCDRLFEPFQVDVQQPDWWSAPAIANLLPLSTIVNINMIHISPWSATEGLFQGAGALLPTGGLLFLYGPYKINGAHAAPSNAQFDQSLRSRNSEWGIRSLESVISLGQRYGLELQTTVSMPANNQSIIFSHQ